MTSLCHSDELPEGEAKAIGTPEGDLIAIKKRGQIHLYHNRCPHTGVALDWQPGDFMSLDKAYLQCSTHGALFEIESGRCVYGPCKNQHLKSVKAQLDAAGYLQLIAQD